MVMLEGWQSRCMRRGNPADLIRPVQPNLMPFYCGLWWVCGLPWLALWVWRGVVEVGGNTDLEPFRCRPQLH